MDKWIWIAGGIAAVVGYGFRFYRELANLRKQTDAAWAQIEAQMRQRSELLAVLKSRIAGKVPAHVCVDPGTYPSIFGADTHILLLELRSSEEKIEFAREYYNRAVNAYTRKLREFPHVLVAASLRLKPKDTLAPAEPAAETLVANFSGNAS